MGIVKKPIFYTGEVGKIDFEDITDMVIAWRSLPEPYKPPVESEEEKSMRGREEFFRDGE